MQFLLGIVVAYFLQRDFRGRDLIFTLFMLPMMLCPIVVGFLWRYMFNSEWGIVNVLIAAFGGHEARLARQCPATRLIAVVIADAWMWTPFVILLATAAFRGIPRNIQEAADIDGASAAFRFFRVTLAAVGADPVHCLAAAPHRCLQAVRSVLRPDRRRPGQ